MGILATIALALLDAAPAIITAVEAIAASYAKRSAAPAPAPAVSAPAMPNG